MRNCLTCGKPLKQKRHPRGNWESQKHFQNRKYCDQVCYRTRDIEAINQTKVTSILTQKQRERMKALRAWR